MVYVLTAATKTATAKFLTTTMSKAKLAKCEPESFIKTATQKTVMLHPRGSQILSTKNIQ